MDSDQRHTNGQVVNPFVKFAIGALAGFCAAVLPRFVAQLSQSDMAHISFFPQAYLVAAGVFALFMGSLIVIFEWKSPAKPRDTFMTALGIPAVIAGAIGTASGVGSLGKAEREQDRLKQAFSQDQGIVKQGSFSTFEPLDQVTPPTPGKTTRLPFSFFSSAFAQQTPVQAAADSLPRFGIYVEQSQYVVVLKHAKSDREAIQAAQEMRQRLPQAQAVKANNSYYVILGGGGRSETDALIEAARAKALLGDTRVQPHLVELKR